MAIQASELVANGPLSRPLDDASICGAGRDATMRPVFTQLTANSVIAFQSTDAADTGNVTITGRNAAGAVVTETFALTGTAEKVGATTFERVQIVSLAVSAVGIITIKQGAGGSTMASIAPGESGVYILFINASATTAQTIRYEKFFWLNKSAEGKTLTAAIIKLSSDPDAKIMIGLATAKDDTASVANRMTAPAGITFVDDNVDQNVPGNTLEANSAIGVWVKQVLNANDLPLKSTFATQLRGTTT